MPKRACPKGLARKGMPLRASLKGMPLRVHLEGAHPQKTRAFTVKTRKMSKILDHFSTFLTLSNFGSLFSTFLTFFQILSRTWGINFDTIACLFELVYGPKKHFFSSNFRLFEKVQNDLGINKNPSKWTLPDSKKYSRRLKPSFFSQKNLKND